MTSDTRTAKNLTVQQAETCVIAMEEMAELTQVLSKCIRFGVDHDKRDQMTQEIGDVSLLIKLLTNTFGISYDNVRHAMDNKQRKLTKWSKLYE